jgi:peptidoglycan/LPS O-acetylase OafA/YrhL
MTQSRQSTGRLIEIESLRGLAASSILVFHCWVFSSAAVLTWNLGPVTPFMQPLQSGVTLFFVLSGFLLYRPVAQAILGGTMTPRVLPYLRNRALRILPAYWVVVLVSGFVLQSSTRLTDKGVAPSALTDPRLLSSDLLLVQTYHPSTIWSGILPAWSLTVEVAFYLALPLLALMAAVLARSRLGSSVAALAPVAALMLVGLVGKATMSFVSDHPGRLTGANWNAVVDSSFLTHADLFAFGMAAALLFVHWERRAGGPPRFIAHAGVGRLLVYVAIPILFLGFYFLPRYLYDSLIALFAAIALLRLLSPHGKQGRKSILRHPWSRAWGRVSYSVFLWNYPVLTFLGLHGLLASGHGATDFLRNLAVAAIAVGGLSFLTYRFVEAPALALKGRRPIALEPASAHVRVPA